jgi:hypothetical protein
MFVFKIPLEMLDQTEKERNIRKESFLSSFKWFRQKKNFFLNLAILKVSNGFLLWKQEVDYNEKKEGSFEQRFQFILLLSPIQLLLLSISFARPFRENRFYSI